MKKNIIPIYKKIGETPYELISVIRNFYPLNEKEKIAYAGRLDPMAEGVVVFITGNELKNFDNYLNLEKEYIATFLFDFSTDTYDIMGLAEKNNKNFSDINLIKNELQKNTGNFTYPFPHFSSYKIRGKPLFWWAREGRLDEIKIPLQNTKIHDVSFLNNFSIAEEKILKTVTDRISRAGGDFRQKKIITRWRNITKNKKQKHLAIKIKISSSSGFYVRSLAKKIETSLKTKTLLFSLTRTKVGCYTEKDCIVRD